MANEKTVIRLAAAMECCGAPWRKVLAILICHIRRLASGVEAHDSAGVAGALGEPLASQ